MPRLCKTAIELITLQKALLMTPAKDCMLCLRKGFANGESICIRQNPLRRSGTRHRPRICADNIRCTDSCKTVLIKCRYCDMIQPRRNERDFERIQAISQQLLEVAGKDDLISADLNQLFEQCHTGRPDLSVRGGICQTPFCISGSPP